MPSPLIFVAFLLPLWTGYVTFMPWEESRVGGEVLPEHVHHKHGWLTALVWPRVLSHKPSVSSFPLVDFAALCACGRRAGVALGQFSDFMCIYPPALIS